jgi:hypothetical protein
MLNMRKDFQPLYSLGNTNQNHTKIPTTLHSLGCSLSVKTENNKCWGCGETGILTWPVGMLQLLWRWYDSTKTLKTESLHDLELPLLDTHPKELKTEMSIYFCSL